MFKRKSDESRRINNMGTADRAEAIKRLERERAKINDEIENILESYAKESGINTLRPKGRRNRSHLNDWDFDV